jgi:hypothetical protein
VNLADMRKIEAAVASNHTGCRLDERVTQNSCNIEYSSIDFCSLKWMRATRVIGDRHASTRQ